MTRTLLTSIAIAIAVVGTVAGPATAAAADDGETCVYYGSSETPVACLPVQCHAWCPLLG